MKVDYSERAGKSLQNLPPGVRKAAFRQMRFLEQNLGHPSLRAKKYDEKQDLWPASTKIGASISSSRVTSITSLISLI